MSDQFCEQEAAIIRAARSGKWEPTLRVHLNSCAVCREAVKVVTAMNSLLLEGSSQIPPIPDPRLVWLKASFAERQKRSALITRIAGVAYGVLLAVCSFAVYSLINAKLVGTGGVSEPIDTPTYTISPIAVAVVAVLLLLYLFSPTFKKTR